MAWLAVSKTGTERIFSQMPVRSLPRGDWSSSCLFDSAIRFPKGSIKNLIGKDLTWQDDAVEIAKNEKPTEFRPLFNGEELWPKDYRGFFSGIDLYMDNLVLRPKVDDEFITWDENGKVTKVKEETWLQKIINCVRGLFLRISRKCRKEINEEKTI